MATAPTSAAASPLSPPSNAKSGDTLFLTAANWKLIQAYVQDGMMQPISAADAVDQWSIEQDDADQLTQLWSTFAAIHDHCQTFAVTTFPQTVSLASDIVDYGRNVVPPYLNAVKKVRDSVAAGTMTEAKARLMIQAVLKTLASNAQDRAAKVAPVKAAIQTFVDQTIADVTAMQAANTVDAVIEAAADQDIVNLEAAEADDTAALEQASATYAKAETLLYVALFCAVSIVGLIAAGIIAGVAEAEVIAAKKRIDALEAQFAADKAELAAKRALVAALRVADKATKGLSAEATSALPVLEQAEGVWTSLADGISATLGDVTAATGDIPSIVEALAVDAAIADWAALAQAADTYRSNATIVVMSEADAIVAVQADPGAYGLSNAS